jgi:hypothetical protein
LEATVDDQVATPAMPTAPEVERRAARRSVPAELPWTVGCRITPGHDVSIVNISAVGMLVESAAPLFPGRTVKLHLMRASPCSSPFSASSPAGSPSRSATPGAPHRVALTGSVVRSFMAAIDRGRGATFHSGIAFGRHFDATEELAAPAGDE